MVGDALYNGNDVVMIPYTQHTGTEYINERDCQILINNLLKGIAIAYDVPMAWTWNIPLSLSDGTHPTTEGNTWITAKIVNAYESDIIPATSCGWLCSFH